MSGETVTGLTAPRLEAIEAAAVVNGEIDASRHLILKRHDETEIDTGVVFPTVPEEVAGLYKIAEITLGGTSSAIDINTIPNTYRTLKIFASLRGDNAFTFVGALLNLNNNTADAMYYRQYMQGNGAAVSAQESLAAANSRQIGLVAAATAPANSFSQLEITLGEYTSGKFKTAEVRNAASWGGSTGTIFTRQSTLIFVSTAQISRVALAPSAGLWVAGSCMSIYGLKTAA